MRSRLFLFIVLVIVFLTGCSKESVNPLVVDKNDEYQAPIIYDDYTADEQKNEMSVYIVYEGEIQEHKLNYKGELTPVTLLTGISEVLKVNITANYANVKNDRIIVDLSSTSAPIAPPPQFDETYPFQYKDTTSYIFCVLDSIKTTLNKYYGEDKLIYLSVNSKACLFQNATPQFRISQSEPYMGQKYYLENYKN